ncbi:MAG: PAS domain-containing protein [Chloroflexi bacterium]|nr:PAS domain-containing protein [Chloroflexota bacterium]
MPDNNYAPAYEFLFRSTLDGILVADQTQLIRQINPAAAAMLAVTVDEVIGQSPEQIFRHNPALVNLFTRSGDQMLNVRLPKRRIAVGIATSLPDGSRMVLLQDITEKQELESRREALVSTIAHDLRNPISALTGFADLIDKFGDLNPQQDKFLTRIRQTASKLYDVVGSLVDLAWIEAGMPLGHRPIELGEIISRTVSELSSLALERRMSIAVSVQDPMPVVMGDPERMKTVIYNLLHNALIYSEPEQAVAIHAWGDEHEAYVSVADRGIGIADDELELIFDRLYRSRDERVRATSGGGLGLTVAKTIITRLGGAIWASSNLGAGSTFTFVLPAVHSGAYEKD